MTRNRKGFVSMMQNFWDNIFTVIIKYNNIINMDTSESFYFFSDKNMDEMRCNGFKPYDIKILIFVKKYILYFLCKTILQFQYGHNL